MSSSYRFLLARLFALYILACLISWVSFSGRCMSLLISFFRLPSSLWVCLDSTRFNCLGTALLSPYACLYLYIVESSQQLPLAQLEYPHESMGATSLADDRIRIDQGGVWTMNRGLRSQL